MDQAALDAAYGLENSIPDFHADKHKLKAESEAAEAAVRNNALAHSPTLMENLDLFLPTGSDGKASVLVFIHGGYWRSPTGRAFSYVAWAPVAAGMCVVNVTYDLCPQVDIGEIVGQIRAAVAWTARSAESFGGDPDRIIVSGHSAGGHPTATTMLTDRSRYGLPPNVVKGYFAIGGLFELESISFRFLQATLRLTADVVRHHSPQRNVSAAVSQLAIARGDADPDAFAKQSLDFAAAWSAAGNRCGRLVLPNANHFEVLDGFKSADGIMTRTALDLEG